MEFKIDSIKITTVRKQSENSKWYKYGFNYCKDRFRICTYIHYYDNEIYPFYIGQGTLQRAFSVVRKERTKGWNNKVKDLNLLKVVIYRIDITKNESLKYEKDLIAKYINTNNLVNCRITKEEVNKYKIQDDVNKKDIACFDLKGNHIKTFTSLKDAAYEYFTSESIIAKCIKNNKKFRGIIYWKKI